MAKLFVGNFPFSVDDEKLKEFFGKVGTVVSAKVMTEGDSGRSRGFGFVEMEGSEDAERAIKELNGTQWDGRQIKVSEDRGKQQKDGNSEQGGGYQKRSYDRNNNDSDRNSAPMGHFRAQPFDISVKRRKKADPFIEDPNLVIDYKDAKLLRRFVSERGKIMPRRMTGLTAYNQRQVARAIKRAQHLALMSPTEG